MSYPELMEWAEFVQIDPEPEWRADARAAQICSILANVNRDSKKRPEPYEVKEFMMFDRLLDMQKTPSDERQEAVVTVSAGQDQGAKIAPETVAWLFAKSRKGKANG